MRLQAAANAFNDVPCYDAYSGVLSFKAQVLLYDETKRDSESAERRVLSVDPKVALDLPTRRVVKLGDSRFILGHSNIDYFRGNAIRAGIVAHEATDLVQVRTPGQVCLSQEGSRAWSGNAWLKNLSFSEQDSRQVPQFHMFFATTEQVPVGTIITLGSTHYVSRSFVIGAAGTKVVLADSLGDDAVLDVTVQDSTLDPVTETRTSTTVPCKGLFVRWQSLFAYRSHLAHKFGPSDVQIAFAKSAVTVKPGAVVAQGSSRWNITSVDAVGDVWLCHAIQHA